MYVAKRDKQMSNPIVRRYSICPENKFTIQTRSYHVINILFNLSTVNPPISSYTRFSTCMHK